MMRTTDSSRINVLVTVDFTDAQMAQLAAVSSQVHLIKRPTTNPTTIEAAIWETVDVLYTFRALPAPEDVPRLRWVQLHSAGVDQVIDHPVFGVKDILLTTTSGIHTATMAEYIFTMLLAFGRRLPTLTRLQARAEWPEQKTPLLPRELRGATLGIVGYGSVGREVARLAVAFGMKVLATKRDVRRPAEDAEYTEADTGDPGAELVNRLYPPEALRSMLRACDFVAVTVPLTEQTRHLIDAEALAAMKPDAVLVNVSRGEVIDEAALIEALQAGRLGGAALDVFEEEPLPSDSPLWKLPNVITTPHIAGLSPRYNARAARLFAENLRRYLSGERLLNLVDRQFGY